MMNQKKVTRLVLIPAYPNDLSEKVVNLNKIQRNGLGKWVVFLLWTMMDVGPPTDKK